MRNYIFKVFSTLFLSSISWTVFAQEASSASSSQYYRDLGIYLLIGITVVLLAFIFSVLFRLLDDLMREKTKGKIPEVASVATSIAAAAKGPSLIRELYQKLTDAVPVEREDEVLLNHNYDGIRELDNRLPPWWLGLFYVSIVFGVAYFGYYHVAGKGLSSAEAWEEEMRVAKDEVNAYLASRADVVDENTVELITDQAHLDAGEITFNTLCATCHLTSGAGLVGPNLTDEYWLHGGSMKDVFRVVKYGVPEKGMISWASQLRPSQMQEVSSYILHSLQGTNPPNPKEPQGEKYVPETD